MAKKSTPDLDPTKLISEGYVEQSDYWYNPKTKKFIYKDNYISGEGAPYSNSPFNANFYRSDPFKQYHGIINNDNLGGYLGHNQRFFNPEYKYQYAGEDTEGFPVYNEMRFPSKSRQDQISNYYSSSLTPKTNTQQQTPPPNQPAAMPLQQSGPQTIGGIANYNTEGFIPADVMANRRGFSAAPPTMQTEPSIGPVNMEYNMARESITPMRTIPLSEMDLSGGKLAPGTLSGGAESIPQPTLAGPGIQSVGKVAKAAGLASKLNPYLAAGTAALGAIQTIGGLIGLAKTKQPEGFKLTPKMQQAIGESESAARYGLGAQQLALAQQNQREAQNTQLYNARSLSGGNLSRAIFGANTFNRLMAGNQLAAQDFAAQQQKVNLRNQMYGQEQAIANQNVQLAQQDYARRQQAYGGAMSSGLTNLGSFFNLQNALRYNQTA